MSATHNCNLERARSAMRHMSDPSGSPQRVVCTPCAEFVLTVRDNPDAGYFSQVVADAVEQTL